MAWRYAMILPAIAMWIVAFLYYRNTKDSPAGNRIVATGEFNKEGHLRNRLKPVFSWFLLADRRIAALTIAYAMCFGMEITFDNIAVLHFVDNFHRTQKSAGFWAGLFGFMNLFARALGGWLSDKAGLRWGFRGKGRLLTGALLLEGLGLLAFSHSESFSGAVGCMLFFALFLKTANGAVYGIVPFVSEKNIGLVSGVVGAGGNLGALFFGWLFRSESISYATVFAYIGIVLMVVAVLLSVMRWSGPLKNRG